MRTSFLGPGLIALTALSVAVAAPAGAAAGKVTHETFHGNIATGQWTGGSATSSTFTNIFVASATKGRSQLAVNQFTEHRDANGNVTGSTNLSVEVTSGFSFTMDTSRLTEAQLSGPNLPATICTFDANFNEIGCTTQNISVDATWTGVGPVGHNTSNEHIKVAGFSQSIHDQGRFRAATVTASIAGSPPPGDLTVAELGTRANVTVTRCIGSC